MKTEEVMAALKSMHSPEKWAFFEELRIGTGYGKDSEQRLDAWAIHYWPSKKNVTRAYEVKVSKSDFMNEVNKPFKRRPGLRLANEFYLVTPAKMLTDEDINKVPEAGVIEVREDGSLHTRVKAPYRDTLPPTWLFIASVCRRFDKQRLAEFMHNKIQDAKLQEYGDAALIAITDKIDFWKNYSKGSKEVPDKIADAMQELYHDIIEAVEANRRIK